ncbi:MAG: hypothetical protein IJ700_03135 [Bacteroidaceae bacterium]|nr:hypothetical protein [Bacteroidaceae bacterium]
MKKIYIAPNMVIQLIKAEGVIASSLITEDGNTASVDLINTEYNDVFRTKESNNSWGDIWD